MSRSEPIGKVRERLREQAADRHISPRDVDLLLADELGKPLTFLLSHGEEPIEPGAVDRVSERLQRRFGGEPLQYIRGRCDFYGREFLVDRRAFIPRPETEFLVEAAIDWLPSRGSVTDIGTGTGCIAITLKLERPDLVVFGIDVSIATLALARSNARRLRSGIRLIASDLHSGIRGQLNAIVSNPPYVPLQELDHLQREVRDHEPRIALTPGGDGLQVIERLLVDSASRLKPNGVLIMEIGYNQLEAVEGLAERHGWTLVETRDDLAAIPRVVVLSR